jgi:hypothetical protein
MREQRTPAPSEEDETTDRTVMLIVLDRAQPWPQSVEDLGRELGQDPDGQHCAGAWGLLPASGRRDDGGAGEVALGAGDAGWFGG